MAMGTRDARPDAEAKPLAAKRPKTGGRVKKSLDQMLVEARIRDELAGMNDDTVLPEELAAIYLGISVAELRELRNPPKNGAGKGARLKMIKPIRADAVGQNQKVLYKLGALRDFHESNTVESSFEAAVNAGLYGFVSIHAPFFAQPEKRSDRGRATLLGKAWDRGDPDWARRFSDVFEGKLRVVWLTSAAAASSRWAILKAHKAFSKPWLAALKVEGQAVRAALEGTEISEVAAEGKREPAPRG
jgi:hypothetical protein